MEDKRVRRLPVVDSRGGLKGIISLGDLVKGVERKTAREVPEFVLKPWNKCSFRFYKIIEGLDWKKKDGVIER